MDKKPKSLIDEHDGDFVLNESGTSVNNPAVEENIEKHDDVRQEGSSQKSTEETLRKNDQ